MAVPPETIAAKLKSGLFGIVAIVGWLALAVPFYRGLYACSEWLMREPFATAAECHQALAYLEYHDGHHDGEWCAELERGGWCAMAYDSGWGTDRCFMP
jgi:hypothetical protein